MTMLKFDQSTTPLPASIDEGRAARAIRELLFALGEDPDRDGLRDTPDRVARMYRELLEGRGVPPGTHLDRTFAETCDDAVIVRDIQVNSLCEHHLLPFTGRAHVAYVPGARVVGLSKLARTVRVFARRLQVQERLTTEVADALMSDLDARGALVRIDAEHMCMRVRGVGEPNASMVTTAARGILREDRTMRSEVLAAFGQPR